jgi:S1-C subfamily serine protease
MVADRHATLRRKGGSYLLEAETDRQVWVNGEPVRERLLRSGDVLEIGRDGPILRFRLYPPGTTMSKSVAEAFRDGVDGARFGGGPVSRRLARGVAGTARELATQTSIWIRLGFAALILALIALSTILFVRSTRLEKRLTEETLRIEGLAAMIEESTQARADEALDAVRGEMRTSLERIAALEARSDAPERVVADSSEAVILLQGTYGFVDSESGKVLRFATLDERGRPLTDGAGEPLVGVGGSGPAVDVQFLGTAFVASADGLLLTNRHVALPWEYENAARILISQGFLPSMNRFVGFVPGRDQSVDATLVEAAEGADLALLRAPDLAGTVEPLLLADESPSLGEEVIVLGYPAGIRALLARTDAAFVEQLMKDPSVGFWEVTQRLSEAGEIGPLASRGIVAQVSPAAVVYDAETTRGGSGGPVLDLDGKVVAITSAIVAEFSGSNLGVPVARARDLLAGVDLDPVERPVAEP